MKKVFVIVDISNFPIGAVRDLEPYLEMLGGLGITNRKNDDGAWTLFSPSMETIARIYEVEVQG